MASLTSFTRRRPRRRQPADHRPGQHAHPGHGVAEREDRLLDQPGRLPREVQAALAVRPAAAPRRHHRHPAAAVVARPGDGGADGLAERVGVGHADEVDAAAPRERVPLPESRVQLHQPEGTVPGVPLELGLRDPVVADGREQAARELDGLVRPARLANPTGAEAGRHLGELAAAERARHGRPAAAREGADRPQRVVAAGHDLLHQQVVALGVRRAPRPPAAPPGRLRLHHRPALARLEGDADGRLDDRRVAQLGRGALGAGAVVREPRRRHGHAGAARGLDLRALGQQRPDDVPAGAGQRHPVQPRRLARRQHQADVLRREGHAALPGEARRPPASTSRYPASSTSGSGASTGTAPRACRPSALRRWSIAITGTPERDQRAHGREAVREHHVEHDARRRPPGACAPLDRLALSRRDSGMLGVPVGSPTRAGPGPRPAAARRQVQAQLGGGHADAARRQPRRERQAGVLRGQQQREPPARRAASGAWPSSAGGCARSRAPAARTRRRRLLQVVLHAHVRHQVQRPSRRRPAAGRGRSPRRT